MKKNYFLLAIAISLGLIACNKSENGVSDIDTDDGDKSLVVKLSGVDTRFSDPGDFLNKDSQDINSFKICLTNSTDNTSTVRTIQKDAVTGSDWDKLVNSGKGLKIMNINKSTSKVYVYANYATASFGDADQPVKDMSTTLDKQIGGAVLYTGFDNDLKPIKDEPIDPDPTNGTTYTADVSVSPAVARMQIKSVEFEESGSIEVTKVINGTPKSTTVTWSDFSGKLKGVYFNNFYYKYSFADGAETLMRNITEEGSMENGQWLFNNGTFNATSYGCYANYSGGSYLDLPLNPFSDKKCYGFNFFPGSAIPTIHLDVKTTLDPANITSGDWEIFNPTLEGLRFANIVKYKRANGDVMTAADFKPGMLYSMDVKISPVLDTDITATQFNVIITVTVEPWGEETLTPGFEHQQ